MFNLTELEQLVAFADCGILSKAAEQLHISQPTITRTMQQLEDTFGVALFQRTKNRIELNDTGRHAVDYARKLLADAEHMVRQTQAFDRHLHTITVASCAPAPLWTLLPLLSDGYPDKTIASTLVDTDEDIIHQVTTGVAELGVLSQEPAPDGPALNSMLLLSEHLSVCVLPDHPLADKPGVTFEELNGFNFLLRSNIGFWDAMCRRVMPNSRFLIQPDEFNFKELIRESALPSFTTNLSSDPEKLLQGRVIIPITSPEAHINYYVIERPKTNYIKNFPAVYTPVKKPCRNVE